MNPAHAHLVLNHIPVIGLPLAAFLLLYGILRKSEEIEKMGYIAFVLLALITVPSYLTGEPAERVIKNLSGVSETYTEQHEDAATLALIGTGILGVLALIGLFVFRAPKTLSGFSLVIVLSIALITAILMAWTANLGGQIRHTELRSDAPTNMKNKVEETKNENDDE